MSWINHISMKMKLFIALLPALLSLCWVITSDVIRHIDTERQMQSFAQLMSSARNAGDVVHELQKERGMSSGFLSSRGQHFSSELIIQRKLTDNVLANFKHVMKQVNDSQLQKEIANILIKFNEQIRHLDDIRTRISAQQLATSDAIAFYNNKIADALSLIGSITQLTQSGKLPNDLAIYYSLLNLKEQAGIERALLSSVFSSNRFDDEQYRLISAIVAKQDVLMTTIRHFSSPTQITEFEKELQLPDAVTAIKIRDDALAKAATGDLGISPTRWFDSQTNRIEILRKLENTVASELEDSAHQLSLDARSEWLRFLVVGFIAMLMGISFVILVANHIQRHLSNTLKTIKEMEKDFTCRLNESGSDELFHLNRAYNQAVENIQRILNRIDTDAKSLRNTSSDIAASNLNLAQRTDEQAASIVETASSMEQIATAITHTADNAREAHVLIESMTQEILEASQVANGASQSMMEIRSSSEQIANIVSSIDEISFQTNLLALNAAVEAARAGEQGKGFAVVASEVRNLAQRCNEEANRIRALVSQNMEKISDGVTRVTASGKALQAAADNTTLMRQYISDIALAASEQSLGVAQIQLALNQLEQVTQQNASLVSQVAGTSQMLDTQAEAMAALAYSSSRG